MDITLKLENIDGKRGMSVYVSGQCVKQGMPEAEASALMARLLNEQFAEAKI
jgi:hypothetical protein